ncbi:uncharacterized protein LOC141606197 [Silene latifolia]|uniref:uncharacterized protein LOC141606197 n=1 Tax=Silene latifolia TaxID=37657 RepID=UPI003D783B07
MESVDRISELPEFILHNILSFLDMKESCRAGVLSKKWHAAWSSIPVLDFQPQFFKKSGSKYEADFYDQNTLISYMGFITNTMQRYSCQKHGIRKFCLEIPLFNAAFMPLIDTWIGIAVQNKVEELDITIVVEESSLDYILPEFLFNARSLKVLDGDKVVLPNYPTMKLFCLEKLILTRATIDDDMLQRIISNCPLIALEFRGCAALQSISVPYTKKSHKDDVVEDFGSGTPQSNNRTSTLEKFFYLNYFQCPWPWHMNIAALRNLKTVEITSADITDDAVFELASGLTVLETLVLNKCALLKCVKISSISLRNFTVVGCPMLEKLTIDAPNLTMFQLYSELNFAPSITSSELMPALSIVNVQDSCDGDLFVWVESPCTEWFVKLQEFLVGTKIFKVIEMTLSGLESGYQIEVDEDRLRRINIGALYKVREIKLYDTCNWELDETSISAFLDGLFLSCRPDVLVIPTGFHNNIVEMILIILKEKEKCWKDPLKSVEVEGFESPNLLSYPYELEIKLKLSW